MLMTTPRNFSDRISDEGGFTLAVAMGILLIASIVSIAAFQAARGDIVPSGENSDRKVAFAAAESGVAWYQTKLGADPDYWQKCDTGTSGSPAVADPVNQPGVTGGARRWKVVSGTGTSTADFSVAVLPAAGNSTCLTTDPASMLSQTDGTFRIRSTGRYHGKLRSIISTFRRARFLDFLYFTDYETLDPSVNGASPSCGQYRAQRPAGCTVIQFAGTDKVNGPLHTNDDLIYCGTPTFGRNSTEKIEVSGPPVGYAKNASCGAGGTPNFVGTFKASQPALQMPPTNAAIKSLTTPGTTGTSGYLLTGTQYIRFLGNGSMVLDTPGGDPQTVTLPPNGVIYVKDGGCSAGTTPGATGYTDGPGCANVYVSGTADKSITIASERDIILAPTLATLSTVVADQFNPATAGDSALPASNDADLKAAGTFDPVTHQITGGVQIGLIADNFVRVYHRITSGGTLASGVRNVRVDAAILSLQHSFIVDNWGFAPSPGTLNVNGAIAQRFRGPVGTGSGAAISTGYVKDYWYDNRLRYRSPPYFLDPVNSGWVSGRENELVPPV